jgi:HSP20 family protein
MLMRFDPFREVDRTAEQLTQRLTSPGVPFDAVRRGNKVIVNFDLPERRQGTFSRQLFLGDTLDTSKVEASYDRGVLTVTIPVAETAQPRKVAIAGTERKPEPIQAESTDATASAAPN